MKVAIECEVESRAILGRPFEINYEDKVVHLSVNDKGVWNCLKLVATVKDVSKVKWGLEPVTQPTPNHAPFKVHADVGYELYHELIADIQCLESVLALSFPVQRINWASPTLNVIFEESDAPNPSNWNPLWNFSSGRAKPELKTVDIQYFLSMAMLSSSHSSLVIPLSFWREGQNEFDGAKFINAFYNFYFILEGLYGRGKTKNYQVLAEFKKSTELRKSIDKYLSARHPRLHFEQLQALFLGMKKKPDAEGVIHALVKVRGELHHFSGRADLKHRSPLDHDHYEAITVLARHLSKQALLEAVSRIMEREDGSNRKMSAKPV